MLNGIEEVVTRADLLDRSLLVLLPEITKGRRRPEKALWADFEQARPTLLGAVLDVLVVALANEDAVRLDDYPRMADFAAWIVAAEPGLPWQPGAFLAAYAGNQENANDVTLEASAVAQAVRDLMAERATWIGTATELLGELEGVVNEKTTKQKTWPGSGQALSNELRRSPRTWRRSASPSPSASRSRGDAPCASNTPTLENHPKPNGRVKRSVPSVLFRVTARKRG